MKKILLSGLVAAIGMIVVSIAVGLLFHVLFPSVKMEYENYQLFRAGNDPVMYLYFLQPFLLSFALAWLWEKAKVLFEGTLAKKSLYYALIYWVVATVPGLLMTISSFKISLLMTLTWLVSAFLQVWSGSFFIIKMNK